MADRLSSVEAMVLLDIVSEGNAQLTQAHFVWPDIPSTDSYTVQVDNLVAIDFDAHVPVRPIRARWLALFSDQSETQSAAIMNQLLPNRPAGMYVTHIALKFETRLQLASLQANDVHTPPLLKEVCAAIIARSVEHNTATLGY